MAKKIVITLHGIRTRGAWQKDLAPTIARRDMVPYPLDYGRFSAVSFCIGSKRKAKIDWFHRQYDRICRAERIKRPSIVAHSFGTYLTVQLLRSYSEVKFDKIIFAGSIADEKFDWHEACRGGSQQVLEIRNDIAERDIWPGVARFCIPQAGHSGSKGFSNRAGCLHQPSDPLGHSGTFFESRYDEWTTWLSEPSLSEHDAKEVRDLLEIATHRTANTLRFKLQNVRANIFVPYEDGLRIPPGASVNISPDECALRIPFGSGATGHVFRQLKDRSPYIATFDSDWGTDTLPKEQLAKVDPNLRWIMSFPMTDLDSGRLLGVMNIDGLHDELNDDFLNALLDDNSVSPEQKLLSDLENSADTMSRLLCSLENGSI
jgi:hypothetical protein